MNITTQDEVNAGILGGLALVLGPIIYGEQWLIGTVVFFVIAAYIWLMFAVYPLLQWLLLSSFAGLLIFKLFEPGLLSDLGVVILLLSIGIMSLYAKVSGDSVRARYWRSMWSNPSPAEEKIGIAYSPYSRPRRIRNGHPHSSSYCIKNTNKPDRKKQLRKNLRYTAKRLSLNRKRLREGLTGYSYRTEILAITHNIRALNDYWGELCAIDRRYRKHKNKVFYMDINSHTVGTT